MGLTGSKSGLFRAPGFIVSPVGKGERRKKNGKGMKEKGIENEREEASNKVKRKKKDGRKDR